MKFNLPFNSPSKWELIVALILSFVLIVLGYFANNMALFDDGNGNKVVYKSTTSQETPKRYSPEIDLNNEAKKYEANSMALANVGFNITNGVSVEAGIGVAYHQDRYYMANVNYFRTTTLTNEATGEIVGEPKTECVQQNFSQWFKQDTKWSPALRLGANGLIPLDGWDKYFISFYYCPLNHNESSPTS